MNIKTFIDQGSQELIKKGSLICENCNETIPIVNDIPRFTFKKNITKQNSTYSYWWNVSHKNHKYEEREIKFSF